jgi:hypothetical protein
MKNVVTPALREIVKPPKKAKSADLLKVLHFNGATTSLLKVPCLAKQSGFRSEARGPKTEAGASHPTVSETVQEEVTLAGNNNNDNDDSGNKMASADDDAAKWLIARLGDFFPKELVKSARASSDGPLTKEKWVPSAPQPRGAIMLLLALAWPCSASL